MGGALCLARYWLWDESASPRTSALTAATRATAKIRVAIMSTFKTNELKWVDRALLYLPDLGSGTNCIDSITY